MATAPTAVRQDDYAAEKATSGGVTLVTMHGTLNETFEGRKLASSIRSKKIVLDMRDVRRFASWGMSEWMDFLRITADSDLYLVECSTYAVSQLNLITGLLGGSKLVSFYASYRCSRCNEEMQTRFVIPRDRAVISDIPNSYQDCPTCGGRARLEDYPAAFFDTIAQRPAFDIDDEVLAFLRTQFHYDLSPDLTRFRAYRKTQKAFTYLRLTGNIAALPPDVIARASSGTTVVDLGAAVFEPNNVQPWLGYVQAAMAKVESLQLVACPPGFLEAAVRVDDLRAKLKVSSFFVTLQCGTCEMSSQHEVDVAANLEDLARGIVPPGRCPSCRSSVTPTPSEAMTAVLRALPARDRNVALSTFVSAARAESIDKLENCLVAAAAAPAKPSSPRRRTPVLVGTLAVLLLGAAGVVVWQQGKLQGREHEAPPVSTPQVTTPPGPTFTRPDWIISDVPSSGYCHDMINRLMCVGVSSYHEKRDDGVEEADDAALDELVNTIGLKISQPYFRDIIVPSYSPARRKALDALQTAGLNRSADAKSAAKYAELGAGVSEIRKRVVAILQATGGPAVPAQRADWYWEEYASESGSAGSEFLVFVRYDVSLDSVRALVDRYSAVTPVMDGSVMTAFPELAWASPGFQGGAIFVNVAGGRLAKAGIAAHDVTVAVGDAAVTDANALTHALEHVEQPKLTVLSGDKKKTVTVAP